MASKYRNIQCEYMGMHFDSRLEMRRYLFLTDCQNRGFITDLKRQVKYPLTAHGKPICDYIADHAYTLPTGTYVTEDAKGILTPAFQIKAKLFEAEHKRRIFIVKRENITSLPDA